MIEFIIGAFLYAKLKKKYSLKPILKSWVVYLPLACAAFYIFLEVTVWMRWYYFIPYQQIIKTVTLLSYLPLILHFELYYNKTINIKNNIIKIILSPMFVGMIFIIFGSLLNYLVMYYNNNCMPVYPSNSWATGYLDIDLFNDGIHILGDAYCKLIPLSDIFDVGYSIMSIGDILVRMYAFIILYNGIKYKNLFK